MGMTALQLGLLAFALLSGAMLARWPGAAVHRKPGPLGP
jgi:hypothetical protein